MEENQNSVASNHVGANEESVDRLYMRISGSVFLINKDYSDYKGKITKKGILVKDLSGNNFRSHVYVTEDNRWFDRAGMPISKPSSLEKEDEIEEETTA